MPSRAVVSMDRIVDASAMSRCHAPVGRSRCLDETVRKDAILDAASSVLQETGYHAASMDRIAKMAGMSKKTLYLAFDSKQTLFKTLVLERLLSTTTPIFDAPGPLHEQLSKSLKALADDMMCPERLSLLRSVIADGRAPEVRQLVGDLFDMKCKAFPLRRWIKDQHSQNRIICDDIDLVTDILFGMTMGQLTLGELTGYRASRSATERAQLIDRAVAVFLNGVGGTCADRR